MGSKKKGAVEIIALQCTECKRKNYTTYKNRKNITGKLEKNKYFGTVFVIFTNFSEKRG